MSFEERLTELSIELPDAPRQGPRGRLDRASLQRRPALVLSHIVLTARRSH